MGNTEWTDEQREWMKTRRKGRLRILAAALSLPEYQTERVITVERLENLSEKERDEDADNMEKSQADDTDTVIITGVTWQSAADYRDSGADRHKAEKDCRTGSSTTGESHTHNYEEWRHDAKDHWKVCSCGAAGAKSKHRYDNDRDTTCNDCGYRRKVKNPDKGESDKDKPGYADNGTPQPTDTPQPPQPPAGTGQGHKCRLCHICPTFPGICHFIWLIMIVAAATTGITLLRKKKN